MRVKFINKLQKRVAYLAIGRSALRNQGYSGLIRKSREFAIGLSLKEMAKYWNDFSFEIYLDTCTSRLQGNYPFKAKKNFGAARKALNLFFRDVIYNYFLTKHYGIKLSNGHLAQLEIPLDSYTTKNIIEDCPSLKWLWGGVKYLSKECSDIFQERALVISEKKGISRIHLDVSYWRNDKTV